MTTTCSKRPRNPRVVTVEVLRQVKRRMEDLVATASVHSGTVHFDWNGPRDEGGNVVRRRRQPEEYAENMPVFWARVEAQAEVAIRELETIIKFARRQQARLRAGSTDEKAG